MNTPKKIHFIWLGNNPKNQYTIKCIESWKKFCPDYEIIEWNETNFDFSNCEFCKEAYQAKKYAFVSDYIRLKVLYEFGGIYLDTDVELLKPIDELLNFDSVFGFENEGYLQTAVMITKPNMPWLKDLIEIYENSHFVYGNIQDITPNTLRITSYLAKNYGLVARDCLQILGNNIIVFPREYFAPKDYTSGDVNITDNTYALHNFNGSWLDKNKFQRKFLRLVKKICGKKFFGFFVRFYTRGKINRLHRKYRRIVKKYKKQH